MWVHVEEEGSSAVPTKGPDEHALVQGIDDSASGGTGGTGSTRHPLSNLASTSLSCKPGQVLESIVKILT